MTKKIEIIQDDMPLYAGSQSSRRRRNTYEIKYVVRRVTEDGLIKIPDGMQYLKFDSEDQALDAIVQEMLEDVVIVPTVVKIWGPIVEEPENVKSYGRTRKNRVK